MDAQKLIELLGYKERAQATWRNYVHTNRDPMTIEQRVDIDIKERIALKVSAAADRAYDDALEEFLEVPAENV